MPNPRLGAVLCLLPDPPGVAEALTTGGFQVSVASAAGLADLVPPVGGFDSVVVDLRHWWQAPALPTAIDLLRPGGWLYAEAGGYRRLLRPGRPLSPRAAVSALSDLGLEQVTPYWLWPDCASSTQLVPLEAPAALRLALARGGRSKAARARSVAGRTLLAVGLLPLAVRCLGLVGRKAGEGPG